MNTSIFKYIEFLLPIHNCVIIPDFGGFIVNIEPVNHTIDQKINIPVYNIVFNPELKHNDGILASYLIKDENLSYNAACAKIKEFTQKLFAEIKSGKSVICGNIGVLRSDDYGNVVFISNSSLICPSLFGLNSVSLKQLNEIELLTSNKGVFSLKYTLGGVAAAAVALFLFITPSYNITDNSNIKQTAGFLSSIKTVSFTEPAKTDVEKELTIKVDITNTNISHRTYYIIVAGEETEVAANRLLKKTQTIFPDAEMIRSADRYRIYVSSFSDKIEAESFLDAFRKEYPKYSSAWLYSKRN
ncbi:MAG: SPOR domain-containing protein [Dysgonomonas sp.]|nr:SPOR domain-containing protein [Dysgonomonas sp.]